MPLPKRLPSELSVAECRECGDSLANQLEQETIVRQDVWVCPRGCMVPPVCGRCGSEMTRSRYGGKCPNRCFTIYGRVRGTLNRLGVG